VAKFNAALIRNRREVKNLSHLVAIKGFRSVDKSEFKTDLN